MGGQRRRVLVAWVTVAAATSLACGQTRKNDAAPPGGHQAEGGAAAVPPDETAFAADCAQVLAGQDYGYCAAYQDGSTWCWGTGAAIQPQSFTPSSEPTQIDQYGLRRLVLGPRHACGLDARGTTACWGDDDQGQGDAFQLEPSWSYALRDIGLGETQTCAIDSLAHVWCWGTDGSGELSPPVQVNVAGDPDTSMPNGTLDVFDQHGRVFDIRTRAEPKLRANLGLANAWFNLENPQQCLLKRSGSLWCSDHDAAPGAPLRIKTHLRETVAQAVTGDSFLCARTRGGSVWCEGENLSGQTGNGEVSAFNEGWVGLADVRSIAAAHASACVLTGDGSVWCWGAYAVDVTSPTPVQVSGCTTNAAPPQGPAPAPPSGTEIAARLGEAGQARGEAACACVLGADSESFDGCAAEENFAPNAMCVAALAPNDPHWSCRAENFWLEAACFSEQVCESTLELGVCAPPAACPEQQLPQVERFCRRFECAPGESLHKRYLCDGMAQCADGSDELNCTPGLGAFECSDGSQVSVPQLCDGTLDCPDGSDEGRCQ